ncbi:MAG TPA: hypothetical protein VFK30_07075 [Anaerolineae bacterium]|nr:hypothetical protein [Anaerolineae bacterium]
MSEVGFWLLTASHWVIVAVDRAAVNRSSQSINATGFCPGRAAAQHASPFCVHPASLLSGIIATTSIINI